MKHDPTPTAAEAARERIRAASIIEAISLGMLRRTGDTWPVVGALWTARHRVRLTASASNIALARPQRAAEVAE